MENFLIGGKLLPKISLKMKLTVFLVILSLFKVQANTYSQTPKITLQFNQVKVKTVLEKIQKDADMNFLYNVNDIDLTRRISIDVKKKPLSKVLTEIFAPVGISFDIVEKQIILFPVPTKIPEVDAPTQKLFTVAGVVTNEDGMPLTGASVQVKGVKKGTITNFDGGYSLQIQNPKAILIFSYIGYQTKEVAVNGQENIDVVLTKKRGELEQVVIVGYGETKKSDLTGSVGVLKAQEIQQVKAQTIDQALVGRIPGVHVNAMSGKPGAGAIVHIRGLSALRGDNQPLYVVDGVPITINPAFENDGIGMFGSRANPLLAINPNNIASVSVLKDASSAAIYGSRAANGVIIITTKRGKRDAKPRFTFSVNSTIQNPITTYDALNAEQYMAFTTQQAQRRIDMGTGTPTDQIIVNNPEQFFGDEDTDWQDVITNDNALWNQYRFGLTGGTQNLNYLLSAQVSDQEGLMIGSKLNRYGFSANMDATVTKKIKTGVSFNYNYTVNKASGVTSLRQGLTFRPDLGIYDENGNYTGVPAFGGLLGPDVTTRNPVGGAGLARNKTIGQFLFGSVYGEYQIIDGLTFKSQINVLVSNDRTSNFSPSFSDDAIFNLLIGEAAEATLTKQRNDSYTTVFSNTLHYNGEFQGGHKLDGVLGISWDHHRTDIEGQTYAGFPDDFILTNIRSANRVTEYTSESIEGALNSIFGRINYNYKDRYLATFTARRDGSTKFGPNNQFGFFPSGALAWNVHNEDFFNIDFVDQLKLRSSIGKTGSDNLASFSYLAYMSSGNTYANVNGIAVTGLPNPDIRWEETNQLDIGLEFALFNNRLNGEIIYFEKNTTGIILFTPLPSETGFAAFNANVADVSNDGWEIMIGGDIFRSNDFSWNSSFNVSFIENNVDNLYDGSVFSSGSSPNIQEGQPIGVISGYEVVGLAQTQEEINDLNADAPDGNYFPSLNQPGDYIYRDINGDGQVTTLDRTPLGDITPEYYGGWSNTVTYKNFDFNVHFNFVQGNERVLANTLIPQLLTYQDPYSNTSTIIYDTWTPENRDASYGRIGATAESLSSTFVSDASYIRLRSISLGYSFPEKWLDELGLLAAKITLSGNNIFTITDYAGIDPESVTHPYGTTGLTRDNGAAYPLARTFTVGLNVTF